MCFGRSGRDEAKCSRVAASERIVADSIMSLVNATTLQLQYAKILHESSLVPILKYGSEAMIWRERSRIRAVQMNNIRGLLGVRRMDEVQNAQIRQLCRVTKGVEEKIDEDILQ